MECTLQVGDEVVCIEEVFSAPGKTCHGFEQMPVVGETYTIRNFLVIGDLVGVRLVELINPPGAYDHIGFGECAFIHSSFRRVEKPKRETSIEAFRKIDREVFDKPKVTA